MDKRRQKWESYICIDGKKNHLGNFDLEEAAARKFDESAVRCGCALNFPFTSFAEEEVDAAAQEQTDADGRFAETGRNRHYQDNDEALSKLSSVDSDQEEEDQQRVFKSPEGSLDLREVVHTPTWFPELGDVVHFKGDWSIRCTVRMAE